MSGTCDFYPRKRNSQFSHKGTEHYTWMTRRENNSFYQFNNRNNNFGKYSAWQHMSRWRNFRGEWKKKPLVPNARSQTARSSLAAENPRQPFTPRFPFNLTVTIPNFSGVPRPDLFIFRNSSAKSVQFTTAAHNGEFPISSSDVPANKDVGAGHLTSNETEINGDVEYLYTVNTKEGELVEVVDLSEDSKGPRCSDKFRSSDVVLASNSIASSGVKESSYDEMIPKMHEKVTVRNSDAAHRKGRKRKNSSEDLYCHICESEYKFVKSKGDEVFKARCGHLFCQQCLKDLDPYKCPECNLYLQKLFKVFL